MVYRPVPMPLPLSILDLTCYWPPQLPPMPPGGDDGLSARVILELLWAKGEECATKLDAVRKLNERLKEVADEMADDNRGGLIPR